MKFLVSEIRDAKVVQRSERLKPEDVIGTPPDFVAFLSPIEASARAQMTAAEIVVTGSAATTVSLSCARCLEKFERPLAIEFQEVYGLDKDEIDVTPEIREALILEAPYKALCRENCAGICATCGENKNTGRCRCAAPARDPRWDALKQIRL